MRKSIFLMLPLLALLITGCSQPQTKQTKVNSVKPTTESLLKSASKTWTFSQSISSQQTSHGVSDTLTASEVSKIDNQSSWTASKGTLISTSVKYKQISLKKWQTDMRQHFTKSAQAQIHLMTVPQINAVLKKLGATVKVTKLSDLVFFETKVSGMTLPQGFIASGHHLYAINIYYRDTDKTTTIDRGQSFTDTATKKTTSAIALDRLNGTWIAPETTTSANDTGKIMIKDGYLYQHRYDSFERSAIQSLGDYALVSLNQNTIYAAQKVNAAQAGYQLTSKSVASGDSIGYLYLFTSANQLIRIGQGVTTTYQRTNALVAASDLPQTDVTIFEQMATLKPGEVASTITVKAGPPIVGMSDSIKYLTDATAGQINSNDPVSINNGTVTLD